MADQEVLDLLPPEAAVLDDDEWHLAGELFQAMSVVEEVLTPGLRRVHWISFDPNLAQRLLHGLSTVNQRMMEQELGINRKTPSS